jgi:MFS family permease
MVPQINGQGAAESTSSPGIFRNVRSQRGLDWFAFFVADVQTGWGPFVAAYLFSVAWTQFDIGLVLTIGTLATFALQIPSGAVVDRVPSKRLVAAIAVAAVSGGALLLAIRPNFSVVVSGKVLHALASCLLGPAVAAISLGLVGHTLLSIRLGRNARFLSLGNAIAAGVMGGLGYYLSNRAIFFFTAALCIPTLIALAQIRAIDIDPDLARGGTPTSGHHASPSLFRGLLQNGALLVFACAIILFQFANAAMLPLMAALLTKRVPETATLILSVCILAPQLVVAMIAPKVGGLAQSWGRRPLLSLCFVALSIRCVVFAITSEPFAIVAAQLLDGISAATLGVLVPLVIADVMRGSGHFNLAQGVVGAAVGIGASFSTTVAGYIADDHGSISAFLFLASVAIAGLVLVIALMPETKLNAEKLSGKVRP